MWFVTVLNLPDTGLKGLSAPDTGHSAGRVSQIVSPQPKTDHKILMKK